MGRRNIRSEEPFMKWRVTFLLTAALLVGGRAAAQDEYPFDVKDRDALIRLKDGSKTMRETANADEAIKRGARWAVLRLTDKSGHLSMNRLVKEASDFVVDVQERGNKRLTDGQTEYIQTFGKAVLGNLRTLLIGTKEKPANFDPSNLIVRINAARILALL